MPSTPNGSGKCSEQSWGMGTWFLLACVSEGVRTNRRGSRPTALWSQGTLGAPPRRDAALQPAGMARAITSDI